MWVRAPHFCATLVVHDQIVRETAPILKWAKGKRWDYCRSYFARRKYEVVVMEDPA